jgi:hypothetical protein
MLLPAGNRYGLAPITHSLVALGSPHLSLEAYPFGRVQVGAGSTQHAVMAPLPQLSVLIHQSFGAQQDHHAAVILPAMRTACHAYCKSKWLHWGTRHLGDHDPI